MRKDISDRVFAGLDGNSSNFVSSRPFVRFCSPVSQLYSALLSIEKIILETVTTHRVAVPSSGALQHQPPRFWSPDLGRSRQVQADPGISGHIAGQSDPF